MTTPSTTIPAGLLPGTRLANGWISIAVAPRKTDPALLVVLAFRPEPHFVNGAEYATWCALASHPTDTFWGHYELSIDAAAADFAARAGVQQ